MARKLAGLDGNQALIRVVGVGGAGGNAVNSMIRSGIYGVEFIALNTDAQDLVHSDAPNRLRLGDRSTKGLGAGGDATAARDAALESEAEIRALLEGSDMVFITAGMGGGTGSGAAPVVARIAREMGALTVGVVTTPFAFEGSRRRATAAESAELMRGAVDALITIPNDRLRDVVGRQTPMLEAFGLADDVLRQGVQGISDIITVPGLINLDFADVRTVMKDAGTALMGIGTAVGEDRAAKALQAALNSPLIGQEISGATGILINFSAGPSLSLAEVSEAAEQITAAADPNANIIFGTSLDESRGDEVVVTVVATGFNGARHRYTTPVETAAPIESWTTPAPAWSPASYAPLATSADEPAETESYGYGTGFTAGAAAYSAAETTPVTATIGAAVGYGATMPVATPVTDSHGWVLPGSTAGEAMVEETAFAETAPTGETEPRREGLRLFESLFRRRPAKPSADEDIETPAFLRRRD
jgi:cell division protein FtsZ